MNKALNALIQQGFGKDDNLKRLGKKVACSYVLARRATAESMSLVTAFLGRKIEENKVLRQEFVALKRKHDTGGAVIELSCEKTFIRNLDKEFSEFLVSKKEIIS